VTAFVVRARSAFARAALLGAPQVVLSAASESVLVWALWRAQRVIGGVAADRWGRPAARRMFAWAALDADRQSHR